jgi:hypothetical protein
MRYVFYLWVDIRLRDVVSGPRPGMCVRLGVFARGLLVCWIGDTPIEDGLMTLASNIYD